MQVFLMARRIQIFFNNLNVEINQNSYENCKKGHKWQGIELLKNIFLMSLMDFNLLENVFF